MAARQVCFFSPTLRMLSASGFAIRCPSVGAMALLCRAAWQNVTCDWRSISVMATVTLRNMLPGSYHIYINAYDLEEVLELRTKTFVDPFSVDIYLGNGMNSNVKIDTVARNFPGGKWFHVCSPDRPSPLCLPF